MRYVIDVDTWLDFLDCMVIEEHWVYGLDAPCCFVCILEIVNSALVSLVR